MALDTWLSEWGVTLGVTALMALMVFIVWDLARRNNAGRYGTFILFIALAMGLPSNFEASRYRLGYQ